MDADLVIELTRGALYMTLKLAVPVLVIGLGVGLMVSLFQAATQIQEQTLAFIPKILAVVFALIVLMPTLLTWTVEYTRESFSLIGEIWGRQ